MPNYQSAVVGPIVGAINFPPLAAWAPVMGLLLVVGYLVRRLSAAWRKRPPISAAMPFWRAFLLVLLLQIACLVPLKMVLNWGCNWKYFIHIPEHNLNV